MGAPTRHRGIRDRPRPALGDGVRGGRRGRAGLGRRRGPVSRPHRPAGDDGCGGRARELLAHPRGRPGRSVQRDLRRSRSRVRTGGRPGRGRGTVHGDLEPRLHPGSDRREAPVRRAPPREERGHRLVPGARGGGAPERGQRLRDGPAPAVAGGGGVPVGPHARPGQPRRRVPEDHRRTRPGHRVPDRGRGPAGERGTRLHPAADAAPDGLARPSARDRARRDGSDHRRRGGDVRRRVRVAPGQRGVRSTGGGVRGGTVRGHAPARARPVRRREGESP